MCPTTLGWWSLDINQQPKGIGTSSCLASPLCTLTTSWPTSPWRRKLESFSRDLEIAEGTLPKWRTSGAKPEDCPRLGLFTHPSTLGGFYMTIKTGLFTDVSKQGLSLPSKPGLTPHHPLTPPDTYQTAIGHKLQYQHHLQMLLHATIKPLSIC